MEDLVRDGLDGNVLFRCEGQRLDGRRGAVLASVAGRRVERELAGARAAVEKKEEEGRGLSFSQSSFTVSLKVPLLRILSLRASVEKNEQKTPAREEKSR